MSSNLWLGIKWGRAPLLLRSTQQREMQLGKIKEVYTHAKRKWWSFYTCARRLSIIVSPLQEMQNEPIFSLLNLEHLVIIACLASTLLKDCINH